MTMVLDDFFKLKKEVDELKRNKDKGQGALDELLKRLKDEHGVTSIKAAKKKLKSIKTRELKLGQRYFKLRKRFDKKWKRKGKPDPFLKDIYKRQQKNLKG